jgi:hypothetical protein
MTVGKHLVDGSMILSRWVARILGLLASGPFLLFLIFLGATVCPRLSWSNPREMPLFCFLAAASIGVLIAWRWQVVGGIIVVVSAIAIHGLMYLASGQVAPAPVLLLSVPYLIAGILFLISRRGYRQTQL